MSTPYERAVEAAMAALSGPRMVVNDTGSQRKRDVEEAIAAALPHLLAPIEALCRDTDGNWLDPRAELPVGEFIAALASIKGQPS